VSYSRIADHTALDGEILRHRLGRIALQHLLPKPSSLRIGPCQQDAHPHPDRQAAAQVAAVVLQVGRKGLQDRHLLLVFRLGLLLVVDEPHQGGGEDIGGERRVDSAEAKPGQPRPTLQVLLRQETLQLRQLVAVAADLELALDGAQPLGESLLLDRTLRGLIGVVVIPADRLLL
jgi:hypothetical protein